MRRVHTSSRVLVVVWERRVKAGPRGTLRSRFHARFFSLSLLVRFRSNQLKTRLHPQRVHRLLKAVRQPRDFLQASPVGRPLVDHE